MLFIIDLMIPHNGMNSINKINVVATNVTCLIFFSDFSQTRNTCTSADFNEMSAIKFREEPFSRIRVVPCGRTERRTDGRS